MMPLRKKITNLIYSTQQSVKGSLQIRNEVLYQFENPNSLEKIV